VQEDNLILSQSLSLESSDNNILKLMNKKINLNEFTKSCKKIEENGLNTNVFVIVGYPGENKQTHKRTYDYLKKLKEKKYITKISPCHFQPYPNLLATKQLLERNGKIIPKENEFSKWIMRKKPLVEYPHLKEKELEEMLNVFIKLDEK